MGRSGFLEDTYAYFIRNLEQRDELTAQERALVGSLQSSLRSFERGEELVTENSRPTHSCLLLSGFAGREIILREGQRQITAVNIAGDFVDLHAMLLKVMDHTVVALTPCRAAFVPHDELRRVIAESAHLGRLLWLLTVIDAAVHRAWIASIGRRAAAPRVGHLICELSLRLQGVGLARPDRLEFPVTQAELADMLGLSVVHVNRSLRELREKSLLIWRGNKVDIPDFAALARASAFDSTYLNLHRELR